MLNMLTLVGRLVSDPEIKETENEKVVDITLAVPRYYKNDDEIYETDFIPVKLFKSMADNTSKYCKKGDLIGIKGCVARLSSEENLTIIAEKITFLAPRKEEE